MDFHDASSNKEAMRDPCRIVESPCRVVKARDWGRAFRNWCRFAKGLSGRRYGNPTHRPCGLV